MCLFHQSGFVEQERRAWKALSLSLETARNKHLFSKVAKRRIFPCQSRRELYAANFFSRVLWAECVFGQFQTLQADELYLVTLADKRGLVRVGGQIEIDKLKRQLRQGLAGLSYLGTLEPALYVNVAGTPGGGKRAIHWHAHAIVWSVDRRDLKARFDKMNANLVRYCPIVEGLKGVDYRPFPLADLGRVLSYILKSPSVVYRIYKTEFVTRDGEVLNKFKQRKSKMRPGDRIHAADCLAPHLLDQLAMAGGEGRPLLAAAKKMARAPRSVRVSKAYKR